MSHFTTIKTKITDLEALKKALSDLGYTFSSGRTLVQGYGGTTRIVDLAVKTGEKYGIGFVQKGTSYEIVADWWQVNYDSGIRQEDFVSELTQRYAYHKVLSEAKRQNWTKVKEEKMADGTIKLVLTKY
jgi:hypothetical protein